jgi:hypothetical protein
MLGTGMSFFVISTSGDAGVSTIIRDLFRSIDQNLFQINRSDHLSPHSVKVNRRIDDRSMEISLLDNHWGNVSSRKDKTLVVFNILTAKRETRATPSLHYAAMQCATCLYWSKHVSVKRRFLTALSMTKEVKTTEREEI